MRAAEVRPKVSAALAAGLLPSPLRRGVGSAAGFQRLAHRNLGEHHDGGIIAFVLGAVILVRGETPGFRVSWSVIGTVVAMAADRILVVLGSLRRARKGPVRVGAQAMPGLSAEVLDWSENEGHVFAQGERWQARGAETFKPGDVVEVANITDSVTGTIRRRPRRA